MARYVLVAVLICMASLSAVGVFALLQNANPALLVGEWKLDARTTLAHQGFGAQAKARPDIVEYVERKSVAAKLIIRSDSGATNTFDSYDGHGEHRITASWRHVESQAGGLAQGLELTDQRGQTLHLDWVLLSEDTLRMTFPKDNTLVFRRIVE